MFDTVATNVVAALDTISLFKTLAATGVYFVIYVGLLQAAKHSALGATVFFGVTVYSVILLFIWIIGLIASHVPEVKQAGRKLLALLLICIAISVAVFASSSTNALYALGYTFFFSSLAHAIGALHLYGGRILDT